MMKHYKITITPFDKSTDGYIKGTLGGHSIGRSDYILDIDMSGEEIEKQLRQTADNAEVVEISRSEFELLSREKLGFYAPKPE
jgi:hypothetical protein